MKEKSAPENVLVSVVMGSDSDLPIMTEATKILEEFGIGHELILTSAHRTPARTTKRRRHSEGGSPFHAGQRQANGRGSLGRSVSNNRSRRAEDELA